MGTATPSDADEADLVRRAQAGEEDALERIFARHSEFLRAFVRTRLPALARGRIAESDVIQEAYVTALARLRAVTLTDDDGFKRWLTKIVEHKVREEVRRHLHTQQRAAHREMRITKAPGGVEPADAMPSPSAAAVEGEEQGRLRRALERLDPADRTVIEMAHRQGLTYPEIGELLGIQPDAARMRHGRALARLGEGLGRKEVP